MTPCRMYLLFCLIFWLIRSAALPTNGAAGPSGLNALRWRRLCTSFKSASMELCHSLTSAAKHLCTEFVDPASVAPLLASRLIALDKIPGVHPIWIGDNVRCIIAKAILNIIRYKKHLVPYSSVLVRLLALKQLCMLFAPSS